MTTWSAFRTAIEAAFLQALTPALRLLVPISWAGGPREFGDVDGRLLLDVVSHTEEHIREADVDETQVSSANVVTLQVTAESVHDDAAYNALRLIEQIRLGLRKESVTAILDAAFISLLEFPMTPQNTSYGASGRKISAYTFDVQLRAVFALTPEADDAIGLIEHTEWEGTLADADAVETTVEGAADDPTPEP